MGVISRRWMWVESMGVVVRRYIDYLILLIHIYSSCICSFLQQHPYFCSFINYISYYLFKKTSHHRTLLTRQDLSPMQVEEL